MMTHNLDRKLVDRTVELAKKSGTFGWKKLQVALDSSPVHGAGRVEDTWNLIGRAMSTVVHSMAFAPSMEEEDVVRQAGLFVLCADSLKSALDIDWDDDDAQRKALNLLLEQVSQLQAWVAKNAAKPPKGSTLR